MKPTTTHTGKRLDSRDHRNTQGQVSPRVNMCPHCGQRFDTPGQLSRHGYDVHGQAVKTSDAIGAKSRL
jgi:hypothetical protein